MSELLKQRWNVAPHAQQPAEPAKADPGVEALL